MSHVGIGLESLFLGELFEGSLGDGGRDVITV